MKVLMVSSWYSPKDADVLTAGVFHYEQSMALKPYCDVALYFPYDSYILSIKSYINKISELAKLRKEYYQKEGSIGKSEAKLITLSYNHILKSVLNDIEPLIILKEEN